VGFIISDVECAYYVQPKPLNRSPSLHMLALKVETLQALAFPSFFAEDNEGCLAEKTLGG
jgi:hypothetical protein